MKTKTASCVVCSESFTYKTSGGRPRNRCDAHKDVYTSYDKKYRRDYHLSKFYGVSQEWYDQKLEEQNHACYICNRPHADGRYGQLYVDHDHKTGKVRGLLCQDCNHGLGKFFDNVDYLEKAIMYLREHSE